MAERSFGPVVVRRRLGSELRRLRDHAGMSLEQVARELEVSPSKISRLETGQSPAKLWDVRNLLTLYKVEDEAYRRRAERWVNEGKSAGWWHPYSDASPSDLDHFISLEAEAAAIRVYSAPYLYGLLQTDRYARALLETTLPDLDREELDGLMTVRSGRRSILHGPDPPLLSVIVDESTLLRRIGDVDVMRAQWADLLEVDEGVDLRVRLLAAGPHLGLLSPFTIFIPREDDIDPTVVNLESAFHDAYWEDEAEVARYAAAFGALQESSLSPDESKDYLRRLLAKGSPLTER